ncbi:Hypothetical protein DHA2_151758 [Giardia duodenalis]|uniref:Uncharacterized protein n=1 Tax=Giardia intestinalis TaxID=5741 RepID=V6TFC6_GIAIN|nr:Hypothetical protein DHA2_151758 [Giardia intestinalis]
MKAWSKSVFVNAANQKFDMKSTIQYPYLHTFFSPASGLSSLGLLHENLEIFNILVPYNPSLLDIRSLSLFTSLGILDFTGNGLLLKHLIPLQSVIVMNLVLKSNPELESLPFSRPFMVLAFPLLWCLDGEYISDEERRLARRLLTVKDNKEKLTRLQKHLLRQAETVKAGVVVPHYRESKSLLSPAKPSHKILKFNRAKFENLHSNASVPDKLSYIYETYNKLFNDYLDVTPREDLSGDILNSLVISQELLNTLAGFKSLYPHNLSILFVRLTTLRKRIPAEFGAMFYMHSLTLQNFPLILRAIETSEPEQRATSRPPSSRITKSTLSASLSKQVGLSTMSTASIQCESDVSVSPRRRTSASFTNASVYSDAGLQTQYARDQYSLSPIHVTSPTRKSGGPLFGFLSQALRSCCLGYTFKLSAIYYEVLRNYYGDGPVTELLSELYGTTLLGLCLGFSMVAKPPEYRRVLHTILLEDIGRGCQFSFYDFHVLTETTVSWYLTVPYDSRFDGLFKHLIVAISIAANIFREYTKTQMFIRDGFLPDEFNEKFQSTHSALVNEITGSADDFAWQASFSQHSHKHDASPLNSLGASGSARNLKTPEQAASNGLPVDHYLHKAICTANMAILTKSYDNKGKLSVIDEAASDPLTNSPVKSLSRQNEHPCQMPLAYRVESKSTTHNTTQPASSALSAVTGSPVISKQQKYSTAEYASIAESIYKNNVNKEPNLYDKLVQTGTRFLYPQGAHPVGTTKAPTNLSNNRITTTFCAGQYHKSRVYISPDFKYSPEEPNASIVAGSDITQYDLNKIQLPQIEKSKVLQVQPSYLLGKNMEEHTLRQANLTVEADLVKNYASNGSLSMRLRSTNYERLQHADVLRFLSNMKEKPRISYPHLNLVQSEVLQAQQKARAAFIQAARQTSPGMEGPEPDTRLPVDDLHINSTSLGGLDTVNETGYTSPHTHADRAMITNDSTETLYPEASTNESVDSVFDSVGELSTSTHQFFTKLAATRKRIAELPFFDEENYKRLLALENRVKKYYNKQIRLRAVTQTTHRRLYSLALREHLQISTTYRDDPLFKSGVLSVIDIEQAGGYSAPKLQRIQIHPKRTDEILQKNLIRHLPRMFKSAASLNESLQFEAVLSGYQKKLDEVVCALESVACQESPLVLAKSDAFLTELEQYVDGANLSGCNELTEETSDLSDDASKNYLKDKELLEHHVVVSGGGQRSQKRYNSQVVPDDMPAAKSIDQAPKPANCISTDPDSSQRPAVSLGLNDFQTETELSGLAPQLAQSTLPAPDCPMPVLAVDGFSAMVNTDQKSDVIPFVGSQPPGTEFTESSNLIITAMMQDEMSSSKS